jgi:hypothetical protein
MAPRKGVREFPRTREMGIKTLEGVSMAAMRYQPWAVISQLQDEINRVFGNLNDAESSAPPPSGCRPWTCANTQTASIKKHAKAQPRRIAVT